MSVLISSPVVPALGGSFLLETRTPTEIFTPEDLNEEQRQIASTAAHLPASKSCPSPMPLKPSTRCPARRARQGRRARFTSTDIPEEYGGVGMDKSPPR